MDSPGKAIFGTCVGGPDSPISHRSRLENPGDITPNAAAKGARAERAAVIAVMAGDAQRANLVSGVGSFLPRAAPAEMLLPIDVRRPLSGPGPTPGRSGWC